MRDIFDCFGLEPMEATQKYEQKAWEMYVEYGNRIFSTKSLGIFKKYKKRLFVIAGELKKDEMNAVYCYFLSLVIKNEGHKAIKSVCRPKRELSSELYDTLPLFSLIYLIPKMRALHQKMGVPSDITEASVDMLENQISDFEALNGHIGISDYVTWMSDFINGRIFRIGRFNFEIDSAGDFQVFVSENGTLVFPDGVKFHRSGLPLGSVDCEDEDGAFEAGVLEDGEYFWGNPVVDFRCQKEKIRLDKRIWKRALSDGDPIVSVHIPSGGPLEYNENSKDFERAHEVLSKVIGDFKAFYCSSWLLDPCLEEIIGKKTNLTVFADRFLRFPSKSSGKSVFTYLYLTKSCDDPSALPEKTSMQRAVKKHLLGGGHIYGAQGIILVKGF